MIENRRRRRTTMMMMMPSSSSSAAAAATSLLGRLLMPFVFLLFLSFPSSVVRADRGGSYTHTIPYGSEECLLIRVPKDRGSHILSGSFDVIDAGKAATEPIRVALYGPDEVRIWGSEYGDTEGAFGIKSESGGKHWLCLENGRTYEFAEEIETRHKMDRTIGFALRIRSTGVQQSGGGGSENGVAAGPATEVENAIGAAVQSLSLLSENLLTNLESLSDQTAYMKAREAMQRNLHEETFANVMRWNLVEMLVVVIVSLGQVANVWWILSKRKAGMDRNRYY